MRTDESNSPKNTMHHTVTKDLDMLSVEHKNKTTERGKISSELLQQSGNYLVLEYPVKSPVQYFGSRQGNDEVPHHGFSDVLDD